MTLEKIVSIPGMAGLYKVIAQMRNGGYVVESLTDQKRIPIDPMHKVVMLKDISIYTVEGETPLKDVFLKMKDNDAEASKLTSKSDPGELKAGLKKMVPDFDEERVHTSDIRKMVTWYALLKDIVDFNEADEEKTESDPVKEDAILVEPETKTPKTTKAKKAVDTSDAKEKPVAKKRAAKKTAS